LLQLTRLAHFSHVSLAHIPRWPIRDTRRSIFQAPSPDPGLPHFFRRDRFTMAFAFNVVGAY